MRIPGLCLMMIMLVAAPLCAAENTGFQLKKQPELQQAKPKKPVKIKLRRSPKDEYTWELSGDDVEELVKADRRLRKMLGQK